LARWLLAAHDRSGVPELSLTQDLIAVMLGVRRATVSIAAGMLQKAGVIRYQHGRITIIDRTASRMQPANVIRSSSASIAIFSELILRWSPRNTFRCRQLEIDTSPPSPGHIKEEHYAS
jgi:hypothetical protein